MLCSLVIEKMFDQLKVPYLLLAVARLPIEPPTLTLPLRLPPLAPEPAL